MTCCMQFTTVYQGITIYNNLYKARFTATLRLPVCRVVSIKSYCDCTLLFWYHVITELQSSIPRIDQTSQLLNQYGYQL